MFNPVQLVIDTYVQRLQDAYHHVYGVQEPDYPDIIGFVGRIALENIANSDAAYHDVNHTILVTDVGQEILRGKQLSEGGVTPRDWLHFVVSLLCHDIGYVRGVCREDRAGAYVVDNEGHLFSPPRGSTDVVLTPYHVNRSKLFVRERFGKVPQIDPIQVAANIEHTRFPVPEGSEYRETASYPGLLRAADLIGQMADVRYLLRVSALFQEFQETGTAARLGYANADDLRAAYPKFFWGAVQPFIGDALRLLRVTQFGKMWVNNLYANVFIEEHSESSIPPPVGAA